MYTCYREPVKTFEHKGSNSEINRGHGYLLYSLCKWCMLSRNLKRSEEVSTQLALLARTQMFSRACLETSITEPLCITVHNLSGMGGTHTFSLLLVSPDSCGPRLLHLWRLTVMARGSDVIESELKLITQLPLAKNESRLEV